MRNQVYIHFNPTIWDTEKFIYNGKIRPDAIMNKDNQFYMVEVDHTQSLMANKKKIDLYKEFKASKQYKIFPVILFITTTEYRQKQLRSLLDGVKSEVLLFKDLQ